MVKLNTSETRALRRGTHIIRTYRNKETGEPYDVELKWSWDRMYYRVPGETGWHRTAADARRAYTA